MYCGAAKAHGAHVGVEMAELEKWGHSRAAVAVAVIVRQARRVLVVEITHVSMWYSSPIPTGPIAGR